MNSRQPKSQGPSLQSEEDVSAELNLNSPKTSETAKLDTSSGSDFHDDSQLEFSAILGDHTVPSPEPHDLRKFMTEYTMCAMCDTNLEIRHETNSSDLKVKEEAYCPSCGIRVRSKHHLMH